MDLQTPDVCIIGAGPSGIAAAKTFHAQGIPFDCFEKGSQIGGLWRYENDSGLSAAYRSLHLNTSRWKTAYLDFPMPASYPDFPSHAQVAAYLESYVDHCGFRDKITLGTEVRRVEPLKDGGYSVTVRDQAGVTKTRTYRHVLVANGHHWCPRMPSFEGEFTGETLHSHTYRVPHGFAGKRVLIIGLGNSGCDIACELARNEAEVTVAVRSGAHVIPKYMFGRPADRVAPSWMWKFLPRQVFSRVFGAALWLARGNVSRYGLPKPNHRVLEEHPTISSDLFHLIGHGRISVKPNVTRLAGDEVIFADGSRQAFDTIVYATGYHIRFPFLDAEVIDPVENEVPLYKNVVHPTLSGLYFLGLVQPWGSIFPIAQRQAEWIADLVAHRCGLPSPEAMQSDIRTRRAKIRKRYGNSARHTIQVDYHAYLAEMQRERKRKPTSKPDVVPLPTRQSHTRAA